MSEFMRNFAMREQHYKRRERRSLRINELSIAFFISYVNLYHMDRDISNRHLLPWSGGGAACEVDILR